MHFIFLLLQGNVGNRVKEPEFIRVLTTAILETSMGMFCYFIIFLNIFELYFLTFFNYNFFVIIVFRASQ